MKVFCAEMVVGLIRRYSVARHRKPLIVKNILKVYHTYYERNNIPALEFDAARLDKEWGIIDVLSHGSSFQDGKWGHIFGEDF